ncbi:heterokaryon incompatibility protein-domain-containing protein [Lasiosphaeris hirsuta]|uniref:Heterokaryon incompatibility protein-domain-containing protein n=1 Tax=Lasiosphaeris hirsuta TaxID=260670 RepID=A0AA39ZR92_9PEZI|nr:heterokaryon incompatibility protein-domain-containing protein [Lasiosphaeris hirsuta]
MQSSGGKKQSLLKASRIIGDTGLWVGQWAARAIIAGPLMGICTVCNNLQARGHEDTLGRTPNSLGRQVRLGSQPRTDLVSTPALVLAGIKTKDLLRCRDTDPKTGRPFRDCRYCRLLCDVLDAFFIDEYMSWITDTRNGMHLEVGLMIREGAPLIINCIGCFLHDPTQMYPRADVELFYESPAALAVPGAPAMGCTLPRIMDTLDPRCMQFVGDCLRQCLAEHPLCVRAVWDFVPTRLLYLDPDGVNIRLCESLPTTTHWAALSHRWGGSEPLKLARGNIGMFKDGIGVQTLPQTFKDAIQVCRNLSVSFLWIDSLCIIQDDPDDWAREAGQMGRVYSYAFLVVLAASSAKPEIPFLGPREEEWGAKTFDLQTPSGARLPIRARKRHLLAAPLDQGLYEPAFTDAWATLRRVGPLYTRGWCFQESYLASRALHFAPGSLIFECKTHRRSDDTPPPYPLVYPGSLGEVPDERKWRLVVESYSSRELTKANDKLHAVSGIAALAPQATRCDYLAGLWRESLLADLLWHVMPTSNRSTTVMTYSSKDNQAAPSWSWASINHGVIWNDFKGFEPLAAVLEASCGLSGLNRFGAVNYGSIKVRGRVTPCLVKHTYQKGQHHAYLVRPDGTRSAEQWFLGDGQIVPVKTESVAGPICRRAVAGMTTLLDHQCADFDSVGAFFFCLGRTGRLGFGHVGLVLAPMEGKALDGWMERIGVITNLGSEWYDRGVETAITLV